VWPMLSAIQQMESQVVSSLLFIFQKWFPIILFLIFSAIQINWYSTITIDGTDFSIYEPAPFSTEWFSHKFKGPGVRYELAISIRGGNTVHIHGPFPAKCRDIEIFFIV
jgi:hypothetical protein